MFLFICHIGFIPSGCPTLWPSFPWGAAHTGLEILLWGQGTGTGPDALMASPRRNSSWNCCQECVTDKAPQNTQNPCPTFPEKPRLCPCEQRDLQKLGVPKGDTGVALPSLQWPPAPNPHPEFHEKTSKILESIKGTLGCPQWPPGLQPSPAQPSLGHVLGMFPSSALSLGLGYILCLFPCSELS